MTSYLLQGGTIATWTQENKAKAFQADVLVEGSVITKIGENLVASSGVEVIDCRDKWIIPGLIDTHRHVWMSIVPGYHCDWLLTEYIVKHTMNSQAQITAEEVGLGQFAGCLGALDNGVTTILDHFHAAHTPAHAQAALDSTLNSGARVILAPSRQSPATKVLPEPEFAKEEETLEFHLALIKRWGEELREGRVTLGLGYDMGTMGPMSGHQEFINAAREAGVKIFTAHVVQAPRIQTYRDGGLLGPNWVFSHCNLLYDRAAPDDEVWATLKKYDCAIASTPEDELGMAHGNPVAFEAVERGVKCGLGVDCLSINSGDLFTQMRFALQYHRGMLHEKEHKSGAKPPLHNKFNSVDAFRLATLGGAEALNMADQIGTVEVGKKADLVILDANSVNLAGIEDPFQGVVFHASNADVETVFVDGEIVKRNGKLTKADWAAVAKELRVKSAGVRARHPAEKMEKVWSDYYDTIGPPLWA